MTRPALLCALLIALPSVAAEPYKVDRADIVQSVRERGAVDAASAADIVAPNGGSKEKPLVIKSVIPEGSFVKKGERILEFDDGFAREQMALQQVGADQAAALVQVAEREVRIAILIAEKEQRTAAGAAELAELVAKNSAEADAIAKNRLELKVRQAEVAVQKAKLSLKAENTEIAKLAVESAELEREAALFELKQFTLSGEPNRKQAELRVRDARDALELTKLRGDQRRTQAEAGMQATKVALVRAKTRLDAIAKEIQRCTVTAPADGIVVYALPERGRFGGAGPVVAAGEPAVAGQKLVRILNLQRLNIDTRIAEARVSELRPGQTVRVRVDAYPNKVIEGRVESISPTAAPVDFRNRDVKVYPVSIALPELDIALKPGMSAEVEIITGVAQGALRVPVGAVVRSARKAACAVDTPFGARETSVVTGLSDGKFVEIRVGLTEGDKVLIPKK